MAFDYTNAASNLVSGEFLPFFDPYAANYTNPGSGNLVGSTPNPNNPDTTASTPLQSGHSDVNPRTGNVDESAAAPAPVTGDTTTPIPYSQLSAMNPTLAPSGPGGQNPGRADAANVIRAFLANPNDMNARAQLHALATSMEQAPAQPTGTYDNAAKGYQYNPGSVGADATTGQPALGTPAMGNAGLATGLNNAYALGDYYQKAYMALSAYKAQNPAATTYNYNGTNWSLDPGSLENMKQNAIAEYTNANTTAREHGATSTPTVPFATPGMTPTSSGVMPSSGQVNAGALPLPNPSMQQQASHFNPTIPGPTGPTTSGAPLPATKPPTSPVAAPAPVASTPRVTMAPSAPRPVNYAAAASKMQGYVNTYLAIPAAQRTAAQNAALATDQKTLATDLSLAK